MSTQVGKGQSPLYFVYKQLPTSNVSAGADSHEAHFEIRWDRNWFRLTETIYMKLKHYHLRDNDFHLNTFTSINKRSVQFERKRKQISTKQILKQLNKYTSNNNGIV